MVERILAAIERLRRRISIVVIEHHPDLVLALVDSAVVLDGRVSCRGEAQALLHDLEFPRKALSI